MTFTQRVRISTGLQCNARCLFCYYGEELNRQTYTREEILEMISLAERYGIRDLDFSGGEPTVRPDLPDLLAHARARGFRWRCIITNGMRLADRALLDRLIESGLNEVLVSVQGSNARDHDSVVGRDGAFARVIQALENCRECGLRIRINSVVTRRNVTRLDGFLAIAERFRPAAYNFICFNDWVNAGKQAKALAVRYSEAGPVLRRVVAAMDPLVSKVTVRYIPFCFMQGQERHVCGLLQNDYDNDEWNDAVKRRITDLGSDRFAAYLERLNACWRERAAELAGLLRPEELDLMRRADPQRPFDGLPVEMAIIAHKVDNFLRRGEYVKAPCCRDCSRNPICDGLERTYARVVGLDELRAVPGETVTDPMAFRARYAEGWQR